MPKYAIKISAASLALAGGLIGGIVATHAGGLERSSQDFDILFEEGNIVEGGVTFVTPQRKMKNIEYKGAFPLAGPFSSTSDEGKGYFVPKLSARFQLTNDLACAAQYRQPWGIDTEVGTDTALQFASIKQKISSNDYGLNCSYRFAAGEKGYFRILGGVSYQELSGEQTRTLPAGFPTPTMPGPRVGRLDVEDSSFGWRLGAAYEIPEYAIRASVVYQSEVKYDLEGTVDNLLVGLAPSIPVTAKAVLPQSVELKLQTGVAPGWMVFGAVKWTDWSTVTSIDFMNTNSSLDPFFAAAGGKVTGLDLYYQDGWTVTGGVGHKFNDQWSGAASLTWDRATTTGLTSQTDLWLFGLGTVYTPKPNFEIKLAGAAGILTSGVKDDTATNPYFGTRAEFGNDFVGGLTVSAKYKF